MTIPIQSVYLKLENINSSLDEVPAELSYTGDNISYGEISSVVVKKFEINSSNFPLYIPSIVQFDYDKDTFKPYVPPTVNYGLIGALLHNSTNDRDYYMTDYKITVLQETPNGTKTYRSAYVQFPRKISEGPVPVFDMNGYMNELHMLQNKFYWGNSSIVLDMINGAFKRTFPTIMMIKSTSFWFLCVDDSDVNTYTVFFNDKLRRYFNFNYDFATKGVKLDRTTATMSTIGKKNYYCVSTSSTNNKLFPFKSLDFISTAFNVQPVFIVTNKTVRGNVDSSATIESYTMNISDIDSIGNSISYVSDSDSRAITLLSSETIPFQIGLFLVTKNNTYMQLRLEHMDSINMLLKFF